MGHWRSRSGEVREARGFREEQSINNEFETVHVLGMLPVRGTRVQID
ncbi:hypothetical protein RESH_03168 [Rhodopirellula europaea SH398]|uniref:Uncharacterized protein n=1 Tax=Rhodopirellula europaea SH398 TaxID=1263868 RepID=M5SFA5_9BACT|nr:hypothetical protein RESH_03168 [Rhodopirellula europaea SH398]